MSLHVRSMVVVIASCFIAGRALAEAYVPKDPAQVLERASAASAVRQLEPLRRRLRAQPWDLQTAEDLARGYLDLGRRTADPRFISYAQATLAPWLRQQQPPPAVLVLSATALQSTHRFEEALALLDRALMLEPRNAQAWLTKATVLQVQGKLSAARTACSPLARLTDLIVALACICNVESLQGRLGQSYDKLQGVLAVARDSDPEVRAWVLGLLGEMAVRLGRDADAENHFKAALRDTPADTYLKAAYADLLLLSGRNAEALDLLEDSEAQDVLLLRLAIAGRRAGAREASRWADLFDARRRAARTGDNSHLREYARFLLEVRDAPAQALDLARQNWDVQREPADVHIYLQAAQAARRPQAAGVVQEWIGETGYEDRLLETAALKPGRAGP